MRGNSCIAIPVNFSQRVMHLPYLYWNNAFILVKLTSSYSIINLIVKTLVAKERVKIAREELKQCYYREGVNHYQKCQKEVQKYLDLIWRKENYGMLNPMPKQ